MIGVFDSGLGGLTVVKEMLRQLPEHSFYYVGDTARAPYGNRSHELIYQFTVEAVEYLFSQGCELVIVACNTASAEALPRLQQEWLPKHYPDRRVLGVIRPIAEAAAQASKTGVIGVVGTRSTISSGAYEREIKALRPDATVVGQACPLLVSLVEEGWSDRPETRRIVRRYMRPLKTHQPDTLVLGCTHYPMLYDAFKRAAGAHITVLDTPKIAVEKLVDYLQRHPEIDAKLDKAGKRIYAVTDHTPHFEELAREWLKEKITLQSIDLTPHS